MLIFPAHRWAMGKSCLFVSVESPISFHFNDLSRVETRSRAGDSDLALISGAARVGILHVGDELREINGLRITPRIPIEQLQRILREACGAVSMRIVPIPASSGPGGGGVSGPDAALAQQLSWGLARRLSGGGGGGFPGVGLGVGGAVGGAASSQAQSIENLSVHSALLRQQTHAGGGGTGTIASIGNRSLSQSVRTLCESAPTFLRALFSYDPLIDDHIPCKQAGLKFDVGSILKVRSPSN